MIAIIRMKGIIGIPKEVAEALHRIRLRRKYSCVVIQDDKNILGILKKIRDYVAYGEIDVKTLHDLIKARAKPIKTSDKINVEKALEEFQKGKKLDEIGIKPFFRLHPPRKGINMKLHFPKGVLGDNKEKIKELIGRML